MSTRLLESRIALRGFEKDNLVVRMTQKRMFCSEEYSRLCTLSAVFLMLDICGTTSSILTSRLPS